MKTKLPFVNTELQLHPAALPLLNAKSPLLPIGFPSIKTELPTVFTGEPIALGVVLDRKKKKERVLIGTELCIQQRLEGKETVNVLFDQERPLGTLVLEHDDQDHGWWCSQVFYPLRCALWSATSREENENSAWNSLKEKLNSSNAVSCFVAYRALLYYFAGKAGGADEWSTMVFERKMLVLTRSFRETALVDGEAEIKDVAEKTQKIMRHTMASNETDLRFLQPSRKLSQECLVAEDSLLPLVVFYLQKLQTWKMHFRICSVCGKNFVAPSKHYTLCGYKNKCARTQNRINKRAYDARTKDNKPEKTYQQVRDRMKKRINNFKVQDGISMERIDRVEIQYEIFRSQALDRKKTVKTKEEAVQFLDWLFEQERAFEKYLEV